MSINNIDQSNDDYYIPFHIPAKIKTKSDKIPNIIFQTWSSHNVPKNMYHTILNNILAISIPVIVAQLLLMYSF